MNTATKVGIIVGSTLIGAVTGGFIGRIVYKHRKTSKVTVQIKTEAAEAATDGPSGDEPAAA
jgi:uncharacterized protein YcfJ